MRQQKNEAWLREHGFDGLYMTDRIEGCGCNVFDLRPCGEVTACKPGYKCVCGEGEHSFEGIGPERGEVEKVAVVCTNCGERGVIPLDEHSMSCRACGGPNVPVEWAEGADNTASEALCGEATP